MLGLSFGHLALFTLVLILIFGTSKLKTLGQDLGHSIKDFKKSIQEDEPIDNQIPNTSKSSKYQNNQDHNHHA